MNIKTFLLNTVRYIASIPLSIFATKIFLISFAFLWDFLDSTPKPFLPIIKNDIGIFNIIDYYINKFTIATIVIPFSVGICFFTMYYILPKNNIRKFIILINGIVCVFIHIKQLLFLSKGFDYVEEILMISMIICVNIYIWNKEKEEQNKNTII